LGPLLEENRPSLGLPTMADLVSHLTNTSVSDRDCLTSLEIVNTVLAPFEAKFSLQSVLPNADEKGYLFDETKTANNSPAESDRDCLTSLEIVNTVLAPFAAKFSLQSVLPNADEKGYLFDKEGELYGEDYILKQCEFSCPMAAAALAEISGLYQQKI
jgi:hypothetical protein